MKKFLLPLFLTLVLATVALAASHWYQPQARIAWVSLATTDSTTQYIEDSTGDTTAWHSLSTYRTGYPDKAAQPDSMLLMVARVENLSFVSPDTVVAVVQLSPDGGTTVVAGTETNCLSATSLVQIFRWSNRNEDWNTSTHFRLIVKLKTLGSDVEQVAVRPSPFIR